jgi:hypothetical protein
MTCTTYHRQTDRLITNLVTGESLCPRCCWGEDQMMLRRVILTTETGTETHLDWARNNLHAFQLLWRLDVRDAIAGPLPQLNFSVANAKWGTARSQLISDDVAGLVRSVCRQELPQVVPLL